MILNEMSRPRIPVDDQLGLATAVQMLMEWRASQCHMGIVSLINYKKSQEERNRVSLNEISLNKNTESELTEHLFHYVII